MAFSNAGMSGASSAEGAAPDAGVEDDFPDLNEEVTRRAAAQASTTDPDNDLSDPASEAQEEQAADERLRDVGRRASSYEKEYRLRLLHRLLLRNVALDKIADQLGISVSQVRRDRAELFKQLREQAKQLDINSLIGDSIGFYNEVMSMALRQASAKIPTNLKLAAMRTSLSARNDMHRFLQASGVYDVLRYRAVEESNKNNDISKMVQITKMILEMEEGQELDDLNMAPLADLTDAEDEALVTVF